jgi:hypothetical protein
MRNSHDVRYPAMRRNLFDAISFLTGDRSPYLNFDFAVHVIFDDLSMDRDREESVGVVLANNQEDEQMLLVTKQIDSLLAKHGKELSDEQYQTKDEWRKIELESLRMWKLMVSNTPELLSRERLN